MKHLFLIFLLAGLAFAETNPAKFEHVKDVSSILPSGEKILRCEAIIPTSRAELWHLLTTTEGLTSFAFPVGKIELKIGGDWESTYNVNGKLGDPNNIHNEIISYLPNEMLSIRISRCPPGFPSPKVAEHIWDVMTLESVDSMHTKVTEAMCGWQNTPDDEKVYKLFDWGNRYTMEKLYERVVQGPTKWKKEK